MHSNLSFSKHRWYLCALLLSNYSWFIAFLRVLRVLCVSVVAPQAFRSSPPPKSSLCTTPKVSPCSCFFRVSCSFFVLHSPCSSVFSVSPWWRRRLSDHLPHQNHRCAQHRRYLRVLLLFNYSWFIAFLRAPLCSLCLRGGAAGFQIFSPPKASLCTTPKVSPCSLTF
jgi:hypothetical protein